MFASTPTEEEVSTNLSCKLRSLPALIDAYVLLVDQVLRKHGFDPDRCEFHADYALLRVNCAEESSVQRRPGAWLEAFRAHSISSNDPMEWSYGSDARTSWEEELLAACV